MLRKRKKAFSGKQALPRSSRPRPGISLAEALTAIRSAVEAAQASAVEALDALALEQKLAPVRKGARVIREIAWRLREIGNDGRICDLIDSQVSVIEAGAAEISSAEAKAALEATFASIADRLAELSDDEAPGPVAEDGRCLRSPRCRDMAEPARKQASAAPTRFISPPKPNSRKRKPT